VEVAGWLLDEGAAARVGQPAVEGELSELAGTLFLCPVGQLEQLFSARSATDYDRLESELAESFAIVAPPPDIFERALALQRDLAHHHGMWHRTSIPDLVIAETALAHGLGVVHVDRDYERIAEVRPLTVRRLGITPP
jgi:predicted nucleic acid-binding protein